MNKNVPDEAIALVMYVTAVLKVGEGLLVTSKVVQDGDLIAQDTALVSPP